MRHIRLRGPPTGAEQQTFSLQVLGGFLMRATALPALAIVGLLTLPASYLLGSSDQGLTADSLKGMSRPQIQVADSLKGMSRPQVQLADSLKGMSRPQIQLADSLKGMSRPQVQLADSLKGMSRPQTQLADSLKGMSRPQITVLV